MTKILILGSQHGDEHSGEKLYSYLVEHHPELIDSVVYLEANPRARRQNVRYIESDMNRSFNGKKDTYEERRATKVLKHINERDFDLVLDMHTTSVNQSPCLIMTSISPRNVRFIQASTITRLVMMNHSVADTSLNSVCPQSVCIEINRKITDEVLEKLCDDIHNYVKGVESNADKYIYEVVDLLHKTEVTSDEIEQLQNFELSANGFYPVLMGEKSYQKYYEYLGFKAYKRYLFKV